MRFVVALAIGAVLAVVLALILGEYPFVGFTPYLAATVVPAIIGTAVVWTGRRHSDLLWAATGLLAGASIGWSLWISTGRGIDPVPTSGWIAVAVAVAWPMAWSGLVARRNRRTPSAAGPSDHHREEAGPLPT
ncbi:MAG: hypothetical protein M3063_15985 [Actinomycetota bacterium]|nr:hypothetical protein [Actinomycetota bacterium]